MPYSQMVRLLPPRLLAITFSLQFLPGLVLAVDIPQDKREKASALFQALRAEQEDFGKREGIVREMTDLGRGVTEILLKQLEAEWKSGEENYFTAFEAAAEELARTKKSGERKLEAENLQKQVRSLRDVPNLSKDMIKAKGEPAMKRLRELTRVSSTEVLATSEALQKLRNRIIGIGKEILACEDRLLVDAEDEIGFSEANVKEEEKQSAQSAIGMDRTILEILEKNEAIAKEAEVPWAEAAGVRDLNEMRILIGLKPLVLDPKLCNAARMHSKDMVEEKFFAHDSPVKGHENPWKRAKLAGTSASAENIYAGSKDPKSANRSWFFSPGHHKNMFGNHRRAGMGLDGNKWTQMFGK